MSHSTPRLSRGYNYHHTFWAARSYRGNLERSFRGHEGLVIPMNFHDHSELHQDLCPPQKPNHLQMQHILGVISLWTPEQGRLSALEVTRDEFFDMSVHENPEMAIGALAIANHLNTQITYMYDIPKWRMAS